VTSVLIVEDEPSIGDGLVALFGGEGFATRIAPDGRAALAALAEGGFDLVLLDLLIPPPTGLEVLRTMRARRDRTPVLVLTAMGAEEQIVAGLEAGADDYLTKPFGVRELVARARALLRRAPEGGGPRRTTIADGVLDTDGLTVERGDRQVVLSAREADLLAYLAGRPGRAVQRDELLVAVWGYRDGSVRTRTVDVHVQQLREKLATLGAEGWITTVRGRGYRFGGDA
jgi:DNA-binding response OmpR family regulator